MANITDAANAYASALSQLGKAAGTHPPAPGSASAVGVFGDLVKQSLEGVAATQQRSEQVSAQALIGKADMTDVLQAVTEAEVQLQTVLALRDKVVSAYEQVMRTTM